MPTPSHPQKKNAKAEKLKKQGNERHAKGQYSAAYKKYSEAIAEDPTDANLWANRAASSLAMNKYMDTISDAQKAVQLDPKQHKAFSRIGEASAKLSLWPQSIQAYKFALEKLPPPESLTPQEKLLKRVYKEGLENAEANLKKPGAEFTFGFNQGSEYRTHPWFRAQDLADKYAREGLSKESSALVMAGAYRAFDLGVTKLSEAKLVQVSPTQQLAAADEGAVVLLSNAITRDPRVFHLPFLPIVDAIKGIIEFLNRAANAWTNTGLSKIKAEAPARQLRNGWKDVSLALAITVRSWIIKGFMQETIQKVTTDFYQNALDVLEWGRKVWKDVPSSSRGDIFERFFVRGVQRLYLTSLISAHVNRRKTARNETIEDIAKLARQIIIDVEDDPYPWETSGYARYGSYWLYPKAEAYAALGWYSRELAVKSVDLTQKALLARQSSAYYISAANTLPQDDEYVASYLSAATNALFRMGAPLRMTLPLCERIRLAMPEINQIWLKSMISEDIQSNTSKLLDFEAENRAKIQRGDVTIGSIVTPPGIVPVFSKNLPEEFEKPFPLDAFKF